MNTSTLRFMDGHPGASCDERERNAAFVALAASLVIATSIVALAVFAIGDPGTSDASRLRLGSANSGSGDGEGFGASGGEASAVEGDGPGGGSRGAGRGARAAGGGTKVPKGSVTGAVADPSAKTGESLVAGQQQELPQFGFTPPTENEADFEIPTAVAAGAIDGFDVEGAAGKGGASGTASFAGIRTHAKSIVYILDFSSSIASFELEDQLEREFAESIAGMSPDVSFCVIVYGLSPDGSMAARPKVFLSDFPWKTGKPSRVWSRDPREPGLAGEPMSRDADVREQNRMLMPPGKLVSASAGNKRAAIEWVKARNSAQPGASGSSDIWDSVEAALIMKPEAIFLLTDTSIESTKVQDADMVLKALNPDRGTRVHTITFNRDKDHEDPNLRALAREWGGLYRHRVVDP